MPPEDFATRVKRLAGACDPPLSAAQVSYKAYDANIKGTNPDTFKSVMAGRRAVTPTLIEAVARVLDVEPTEFIEYRLALARRMLDEREVGLDQALDNLTRIEAALTRPRKAAGRARQPADTNPKPAQATPPARRTRKAT